MLERVKFLAITASNLDEFMEVRVAGRLQQVAKEISSSVPMDCHRQSNCSVSQRSGSGIGKHPIDSGIHASYIGPTWGDLR